MKQLVIFLTMLAYCIPALQCVPLIFSGQSQAIYIGPDNIEALASHLDDSLVVEERAIRFTVATSGERLIEVPLGFVDPHATIQVTVGLDDTDSSAPARDYDPHIGISDGSALNDFVIRDAGNYAGFAPCHPVNFASHDDRRVSERTHAPAQATMLFRPLRKYGACYLPLDGGYVNTGTFNNQLDTSRALSLSVRGHDPNEQYRFYYFIVEIF